MLLNQNNTRRRNSYLVCWRRWRPCLFSAPSSSLFLWFFERLVSVLLVFDRSPVLPRFSVSMCLLRDGRRRWYMKVWWLPLHLCFVRPLSFSLQFPFCDVSVYPPARCLCVCFLLSLVFFFWVFYLVSSSVLGEGGVMDDRAELCFGSFPLGFGPIPPVSSVLFPAFCSVPPVLPLSFLPVLPLSFLPVLPYQFVFFSSFYKARECGNQGEPRSFMRPTICSYRSPVETVLSDEEGGAFDSETVPFTTGNGNFYFGPWILESFVIKPLVKL